MSKIWSESNLCKLFQIYLGHVKIESHAVSFWFYKEFLKYLWNFFYEFQIPRLLFASHKCLTNDSSNQLQKSSRYYLHIFMSLLEKKTVTKLPFETCLHCSGLNQTIQRRVFSKHKWYKVQQFFPYRNSVQSYWSTLPILPELTIRDTSTYCRTDLSTRS